MKPQEIIDALNARYARGEIQIIRAGNPGALRDTDPWEIAAPNGARWWRGHYYVANRLDGPFNLYFTEHNGLQVEHGTDRAASLAAFLDAMR